MEFGECQIPPHWLTVRVDPSELAAREDPQVAKLLPHIQEGDELWYYDEASRPGSTAGERGLVLMRNGQPMRVVITGVQP